MSTLLSLDLKLIGSVFYLILAIAAAIYLVYFIALWLKTHFNKGHGDDINSGKGKNVEMDNNDSSIRAYDLNASIRTSPNKVGTLAVGLSSIIGTRKYQQDSAIVTDEKTMRMMGNKKCIAVLCDGMGGMEGGEIASTISAKTMFDDYLKTLPKNVPVFFHNEVRKLDKIVCNLTNEKDETLNSGSTLVSVVVEEGKMYWVSVGDSRIYVIRKNKIAQLTTDHNYYYILRQQAENGIISYEEASHNPKGEALISYIGLGRESEIGGNKQPIPLEHDDLILLCSDGLYKALSNNEILEIAQNTNSENISYIADSLTAATMAKHRKAQDNTTVILIKYNGNNIR